MPQTLTLLAKWRLLQAINADPKVKPIGVMVAVAMLDNLNTKTLRCDPSARNVAQRINRSERTVRTGWQNLIDAGWLRARRRRRSWAYEFAFERMSDRKNPASHDERDRKIPSHQTACDLQESALQKSASKYGKDSIRESQNTGRGRLTASPSSLESEIDKGARAHESAHRDLDSWHPSPAGIELARQHGLTDTEIEAQLPIFREANVAASDLDKAWRDWLVIPF